MRYDDPNAPISGTVAVISAVVVLVTVLLLESLYYKMQNREFEAKVVAPKNQALEALKNDQTDLRDSYGWVDQEKGIARIPVEQAMQEIVADAD